MLTIDQESPRQEEVAVLLAASDAYSQALYPPESNHLVDVAALEGPNVRFLVARLGGRTVGCAAVVLGGGGHGEIKRMFVDERARGSGVGAALLNALEDIARKEGVRVLQLETGNVSHPALALYRRHFYVERGPFGSYREDPLSVFMEKRI